MEVGLSRSGVSDEGLARWLCKGPDFHWSLGVSSTVTLRSGIMWWIPSHSLLLLFLCTFPISGTQDLSKDLVTRADIFRQDQFLSERMQ